MEHLVVPEIKYVCLCVCVFKKKKMGNVRRTPESVQKILQWPKWNNLNNKINSRVLGYYPKKKTNIHEPVLVKVDAWINEHMEQKGQVLPAEELQIVDIQEARE